MGFYARHILPCLLHAAMRQETLLPFRTRVAGAAEGRVLEIGIGSGLNLPLYGAGVSGVVGVDPSPALLSRASAASGRCRAPVMLVEGSAEALAIEDRSVDTVVSTWSLCTIPDADKALAEVRRVLRPWRRDALRRTRTGARARRCPLARSPRSDLDAHGRRLPPEPGHGRSAQERRFPSRRALDHKGAWTPDAYVPVRGPRAAELTIGETAMILAFNSPRQRGRFAPLLVVLATLGACSGPPTSKPAGLLGYGTPGVSMLGQGTPAVTVQEELDRCSGVPHAGAVSQAPGLPAACSQLQRTVRNQPGNSVQ